jgi:hypothetical protein
MLFSKPGGYSENTLLTVVARFQFGEYRYLSGKLEGFVSTILVKRMVPKLIKTFKWNWSGIHEKTGVSET